jgi:hypothetical protein
MHSKQLQTISNFIVELSQAEVIQQTGIKYIQLHNALLCIRDSIERTIKTVGKRNMSYDELSDVQFRFSEAVVCIKGIYRQLKRKEVPKQFDIFEDKFLWLHDLVQLDFTLPNEEEKESVINNDEKDDSVFDDEDYDDEEEEIYVDYYKNMESELVMFGEKLSALKMSSIKGKVEQAGTEFEEDYDFF